jgi:hypothetical protein
MSAHTTHMAALLDELQHADQIIIAMLNAMTSSQKSKVHNKLDAAGVSGEGMTRYHERHAAIDAAKAMLAAPVLIAPAVSAAPAHEAIVARSIAALNVADLGLANLEELETLIGAIDAIAEKNDGDPAAMTKQLRTIRRLAHFGRFFAAERVEVLQCMRDEIADEHAALKAGAA